MANFLGVRAVATGPAVTGHKGAKVMRLVEPGKRSQSPLKILLRVDNAAFDRAGTPARSNAD
jgi:hypothetical protein